MSSESAAKRLASVLSHMSTAKPESATVAAAPTAGSGSATTKSSLSSHVLNTTTGKPGVGVAITLDAPAADGKAGEWRQLFQAATDSDGRVTGKQFPPLDPGVYRLTFDTGAYFAALQSECFYPHVQVTFKVSLNAAGKGQHFHVPCLLSPYGFSTYRGS